MSNLLGILSGMKNHVSSAALCAIFVLLSPMVSFGQQTTITTWMGTTTDYDNNSNWDVAAPVGSGYLAYFDATPGLTNPNVTTATTTGGLSFASGATGYTFTGSTLTLDPNSSSTTADSIVDSSANTETINNIVALNNSSSGTDSVVVNSGATLNLAGGVIMNKSTGFSGAGTIDVGTSFTFANNTQQFNYYGPGTLNLNASITYPGYSDYNGDNFRGGTVNISKAQNSSSFIALGGSVSYTNVNLYYTAALTDNTGAITTGLNQTSGTIVVGANISTGGTVTLNATNLKVNYTDSGVTTQLYAASGNTLGITGIVNYGSTGSAVQITGTGLVKLSGGNTYASSGTTVESGAMLYVSNTSNSATGTGALTVAGTLGGNGIIAPSAVTTGVAVNIASGGKLSPSLVSGTGYSHLTLTLASGSTMNLASGSLFNFNLAATTASDEVLVTGGGLTLNSQTISNFTFNTESGFTTGTYKLIDDTAGITGTASGSEAVGSYYGTLLVSGNDLELVVSAVPEPSSVALLGLGLLALLGLGKFRKQLGRSEQLT